MSCGTATVSLSDASSCSAATVAASSIKSAISVSAARSCSELADSGSLLQLLRLEGAELFDGRFPSFDGSASVSPAAAL